MSRRVRVLSMTLSLAVLVAAPVQARSDTDAIKLRDGVVCAEQKTDAFEGETHRCYFSPQRFGRRDFTTRNGRTMHVITLLGPDCDEIEILGDGKSERVAADGGELRQVSVHCEE
jgi:hypothetical protein